MDEVINRKENELEKLNQEVVKKAPHEEYETASTRRKRFTAVGVIFLLVVELTIGGFFSYEILLENFHIRVFREYEVRHSGQIQLATGVYSGETDFGYFDGEGKYIFNSGSVYEGSWKNNTINGKGNLNVPIEGNYEGEFSNSQKNGKGTFCWDDGSVYSGEWKNDKMCGQGTYTSFDGVIYKGTFQDNSLWNGSCSFDNSTGEYVLSYKDGSINSAEITFADGTIYSGQCADTLSGTGIMQFPIGDQYNGTFDKGLRCGNGVYTWQSGDKYDGCWKNDLMSGTGTYTYANGSTASGTFEDNLFINGTYTVTNEYGTYKFTISDGEPTAVDLKLTDGTKYVGDMKDGKLTGTAQITYSNGDKYDGKVSDGMKSGKGVYTWSGGASYDGNWKEDRMEGTGTYYYGSKQTGYKLSGGFKNGRPDGECQYYVSASEHYKTDWKNGSCVKVYE